MVTLGRPFHLGMLYDLRTDKIISGITLWDPQTLQNYTSTRTQPYTGYEIIAEDSLQQKAHALGVEASLKLSLLGGLISVSGSAKYVDDHQKSHHQTRLTLKYSTTTHFEQLTMKHLGKGKMNHPDAHDTDLATHVVTGVLYGAEAFFLFDRLISNGESKKEIAGSLRAIFDKSIFKVDGEAKLNLTDNEKSFVNKLNCKFYGDFRLSENPNTFTESVKVYQQLPSMLGKNYEHAVPKTVWLYPLHLLDNRAMRTVREISSNLIDYSIAVMENLRSLEVTALDLSESPILIHLNLMKKHLLDFSTRLSELQRDLKEKIALYLPKLRGNTGVEESVLFDLFKKLDSSPFNQQLLKDWLQQKEREITLITKWIENLTKDRRLNITIRSSSLNDAIGDIDFDYIFCLSFRFVKENDSQLFAMYNYRYGKSDYNASENYQKRKSWFDDHRMIAVARDNLRKFIDFAKGNSIKNGKIKLIVNEDYLLDHMNTTDLILYKDGIQEKNFILPSTPGIPMVILMSNKSVMLEWTDDMSGSEKVINYKVTYRSYVVEKMLNGEFEREKRENWAELYTNDSQKKIKIENLTPNTTFVFRVQAVTEIGLSPISGLSAPIEIPAESENQVNRSRPLGQSMPNFDRHICAKASWDSAGDIVAGQGGDGYNMNELEQPAGLFVNHDGVIYVADTRNHRIMRWLLGTSMGKVVAGGNRRGCKSYQLNNPSKVIVDENETMFICDRGNRRISRWHKNHFEGEIILDGIDCYGLAMDKVGSLYISDYKNHLVLKWPDNKTVAGGNGRGSGLHQLDSPMLMFVDDDLSVFVADSMNHRVVKWSLDAKQGIIVAGGQGRGNGTHQLRNPTSVLVDQLGTVYVSDSGNDRIMRWLKDEKDGETIIGGRKYSEIDPHDLTFDDHGNLYVSDGRKGEVKMYSIDKKFCSPKCDDDSDSTEK